VVTATLLAAASLTVAFAPYDRDHRDSWPEWYDFLYRMIPAEITPGLDLQGGLHLQYQVDVEAAIDDKIEGYAEDIKNEIREQDADAEVDVSVLDSGHAIRVASETANPRDFVDDEMIEAMNLVPSREAGGALRLSLDSDYVERMKDEAVGQTVDTISRRINDMGLAEPSIQPRGGSDIIIQLPGLSETRFDEVKSIIETTAQLEFRLMSPQDRQFWQTISIPQEYQQEVSMVGGFPQAESLTTLKQALSGVDIPEGTEVGYEEITEYDPSTREQVPVAYRARLMRSTVYLTGDTVASAQPARDAQSNQPVVSMTFDREGARAMGRMTGEHLDELMVIVLDDIIVSVATIQGRITSRGQITMGRGGNDEVMYSEASHIAVALRNGALVAPIEKQFETHVGPTLGKESIEKGELSLAIAFLGVVIFVLFFYKLSGLVANTALFLNLAFIFAILAAFNATLTLPGLAGVTLTIGMAVDANVIIFERIKEELALGRNARAAINAGYEKAFSAIVDANLTSGIAALVLYQFGSGPVRGFALTLIIGIICSVFTALVATRLIFDYFVEKVRIQKLSI
jgi:preprotein translocase subunit SecD